MTLKSAQEAVKELSASAFQACEREGYRYALLCSNYGEVQQRWLVFESENSRNRDLKTLEKQLQKTQTEVSRQVNQLARQENGLNVL